MAWFSGVVKGLFEKAKTPKADNIEFLAGGETNEKVQKAADRALVGGAAAAYARDGAYSPLSDDEIDVEPKKPLPQIDIKAIRLDAAAAAAAAAIAKEGSASSSTGSSPVLSDLEEYDPSILFRPLSPSDIVNAPMPSPPEFILKDQEYRAEFETLTDGQEIAEKDYLQTQYLLYRTIYKEHIDGTEESDPTITTDDLFKAVKVLLKVDEEGLTYDQRANLLDHVVLNNLRYEREITNLTPENKAKREAFLHEADEHLESYYEKAFEECSLQRDLFRDVILNQFSNNSLEKYKTKILEEKNLQDAKEFNKASNETYLEVIFLVMRNALKETKPSDELADIDNVEKTLKRHIESDEVIRAYLKTFQSDETQGYFEDVSRDLKASRSTFEIKVFDKFEDEETMVKDNPISNEEKSFETNLKEISSLVEGLNSYQDLFDATVNLISFNLSTLEGKQKEKILAKKGKPEPKPIPKAAPKPAAAAASHDVSSDKDRIQIKRKLKAAFEFIKQEKAKEKPNNDPLFVHAINQKLKEKKINDINKLELHQLNIEELIDYISSFYSNLLSISNEKLKIENLKIAAQTILKEKSIPTLDELIKLLDISNDSSINKESPYAKKMNELTKTLKLLKRNFEKKSS